MVDQARADKILEELRAKILPREYDPAGEELERQEEARVEGMREAFLMGGEEAREAFLKSGRAGLDIFLRDRPVVVVSAEEQAERDAFFIKLMGLG